MLVGDTRTFRAVGKDGRIRHNVRWSVSPADAAELTTNGDEATLRAVTPSSTVALTAYAGGDSAEAKIEIHSDKALAPGTAMWSVASLPGCKSEKMTQAVPTANGPDLYVQETCPDGTVIRAFTADGRELWRRKLGERSASLPPNSEAKEQAASGEHLNLSARSLCDAVASGATKDAVAELAQRRSLRLDQKQRDSDRWVLEEEGFRCTIFFDQTGAVKKKTKTIISD
jgi:hypothetical protein